MPSVVVVIVALPAPLSLLRWGPISSSVAVVLVLAPCPPLGPHLPMLLPIEPGLLTSASKWSGVAIWVWAIPVQVPSVTKVDPWNSKLPGAGRFSALSWQKSHLLGMGWWGLWCWSKPHLAQWRWGCLHWPCCPWCKWQLLMAQSWGGGVSQDAPWCPAGPSIPAPDPSWSCCCHSNSSPHPSAWVAYPWSDANNIRFSIGPVQQPLDCNTHIWPLSGCTSAWFVSHMHQCSMPQHLKAGVSSASSSCQYSVGGFKWEKSALSPMTPTENRQLHQCT